MDLARFARICRAAVSGAIGTSVDVAVLWLASAVLATAAGTAAVLGCFAGGAVNFAITRTWAFERRGRSEWLRDAAFYAIAIVGGCALWSAAIVHASVTAGIPILVAKAIAIPIVMLGWTYPVCARVVFSADRCRRPPAVGRAAAGARPQRGIATAA